MRPSEQSLTGLTSILKTWGNLDTEVGVYIVRIQCKDTQGEDSYILTKETRNRMSPYIPQKEETLLTH